MAEGFKPIHNLPGISKIRCAIPKHGLALGLYLNSKDLLILDDAVQKPLLNFLNPAYQKICVLVLNCSIKMCKKIPEYLFVKKSLQNISFR